MAIHSISHTFYDFEIERLDSPKEIHLVKVLSVDGRRFTYEVQGPLTEDTVVYIKSLIDAVVFGDMIIERTNEGFEAREAKHRLKKHS
jgi:3-keto-L-gulonate-6-phosphate decarboxylase